MYLSESTPATMESRAVSAKQITGSDETHKTALHCDSLTSLQIEFNDHSHNNYAQIY